jgi:hypothetical protein
MKKEKPQWKNRQKNRKVQPNKLKQKNHGEKDPMCLHDVLL